MEGSTDAETGAAAAPGQATEKKNRGDCHKRGTACVGRLKSPVPTEPGGSSPTRTRGTTMPAMALPQPTPVPSSGARLVSTDGQVLPLRSVTLAVDACAGLARVRLRHRFVNPTDDPLRVTWRVPLPVDSAVSGYAFELADRRVEGVIDRREAARQRFEQALVEGRTAALLEEERSSLFTQEVGNLPPHSEVVCELLLDQRLQWLPSGAWQWRFPTTVAPRFMGGPGRVPDADRVTVDVSEHDHGARLSLDLDVRDTTTGAVTSPSHPLRSHAGTHRLASPEGAPLDRDVVVSWPVAAPTPGVALDLSRPAADRSLSGWTHALLTVVPPARPAASVARDLVVLLDTSGSMGGAPLAQAKAVTRALLESLDDADTIELIEFSNRPRSWKRRPVAASARHRRAAIAWVEGLRAGGGTQMRDGILAALAAVRDEAQRQIILVTDGLIGFEAEIIGEIARNLPRGSRVHTLGIGSGVNRTLTGGAARAGGGIEAIIGIDEDPADAARRLVAHTAAPLVVDLTLSGDALVDCPLHRLPDLMAGAPAMIPLRLRPEGGSLRVEGHTRSGPWQQQLHVAALDAGEGSPAVITLVGRAAVDAAELAEAHTGQRADATIEQLGLDYRIATRRTSWVAVSDLRTVDPGAPTRHETVPQALPHGTNALGFGLRRSLAAAPPAPAAMPMAMSSGVRRKAAKVAPPASRTLFSRRPAGPPPEPQDFEVDALEAAAFDQPAGASAPEPLHDEGRMDRKAARSARPGRGLFGRLASTLRSSITLRGRLRALPDGRLVLEITLDRPLSWDPEEVVHAVLDGDVELPLRAHLDASTRPGDARKGQVLRLVLEGLPADVALDALRLLVIESAGRSLTVRV